MAITQYKITSKPILHSYARSRNIIIIIRRRRRLLMSGMFGLHSRGGDPVLWSSYSRSFDDLPILHTLSTRPHTTSDGKTEDAARKSFRDRHYTARCGSCSLLPVDLCTGDFFAFFIVIIVVIIHFVFTSKTDWKPIKTTI